MRDAELTRFPSKMCPMMEAPEFERLMEVEDAMSSTFHSVAEIIADTGQVPLEEITPDSHAINDLEIDSLDFLDVVFAIDKTFGIKIPLETWTKDINEGQASSDKYFIMSNLCAQVDELIAAKAA